MSRQLPAGNEGVAGTVIDGLEFAREGRRMSGGVQVSALSRLVDVLADDSGDLAFDVAGELDGQGNAYLVLKVAGTLGLRCQRCLGVLDYPVAIDSRLLLVPPGKPWPDEELADDGFDAVEAVNGMALLPLVEDEVLLALPAVPRHEACEPPAPASEEREPSPFAVLAKLKKT